jgi:hypothetical protein
MAQTDQIKEITAKLEQGVKDLFDSDKYAAYLQTMSRFHKYSTRNTVLIHMQDPTAHKVGGFNFWKREFNRYVKKGEHGIKIFAPIASKGKPIEVEKLDPETKQPVLDERGQPIMETLSPTSDLRMRFKIVTVFSERQTDGDPLPDLVEDLYGNVERYDLFVDALRAISPLPIEFEPMTDKDGYCQFGVKIGIREGMSEVQTVSAIVHELSHAKLHDRALLAENAKPKDRRTEEVEAESCAYSTLAYYGIDTGANSIPYVLDWSRSRELKELNASLDTIRKATAEMIDAIDEKYRELAKERGIDLTVATPPTAAAEMGVEQNYNMVDGIINNEPPKTEQESAQIEQAPTEPEKPDYSAYSAILEGYARYAEVRDTRQIGLTILMPLLFEDGNLNRENKRSRVKVEPPIGKYEIFSHDEGTPPHQTNYLYIMTACGKLADLGETERIKDLTEARLDDYILRNAAAFDKQLAEPAEWVDYTAAALLNRMDEAEAHNAPVKAMREARSQAEREARIERDKQLAAEKLAIFDARVDEIAKAIESGGQISVAYDAGAYEGKNPVLELFRLYGVNLPLRTQGWVNNRLSEIKGEGYAFYNRNGGKASSAFMDSYRRLMRAVKLTPIERKREQLNQQTTPRRGSEKIKMSIEQENYAKFAEMFPDFASRKYSYMKLESPGFEPLSLEWIFGDRVSVMQTYVQEGDLMYDPMIEYTVSDSEKSMNGVAYQNSGMGLYQYKDENGVGRSVDGNGRENIVRDLSGKLNEFTAKWLDTLEQQEHIPVRATLWNEGGIDDVDVVVTFDKDGNVIVDEPQDVTEPATPDNAPDELDKPSDDVGAYLPEKPDKGEVYVNDAGKEFSIGMGHLGNGLAVWNRLEEQDGDYVSIAHINNERNVTFYEKDLPQAVIDLIEREARTNDMTISATQNTPIFRTPPDGHVYDLHYYKDNHGAEVYDSTGDRERFVGRVMLDGGTYFPHDNTPDSVKAEIEAYAKTNYGAKDAPVLPEEQSEKPEPAEPIPKVGIGFGGTPLPVYDSETGYPAPTPPPRAKEEKPAQAEKQTTLDLSLPDPTVTTAMIHEYGYGADYDGILPMTTARAVELHDAGLCIYLLYPDNTEAMAFDRDEIRLFDGYCGIETADWHNSAVYKAQMAIADDAPSVSDTRASESNAREADLLYGDNPYYRENKFGIYQIRDDIDEARNFRSASMKELEALGLTPNRDNYELVYTATLQHRIEYLTDIYPALNRLYEQFNVDHPADYTGRSLSVGDVVVLRCNGDITAHFVDSTGFVELPFFTGDEHTDATISQVGKSVESETPKQGLKLVEKPAHKGKPSILGDLDEATKIAASGGKQDNHKKNERGHE